MSTITNFHDEFSKNEERRGGTQYRREIRRLKPCKGIGLTTGLLSYFTN
jgi:hypothetical protein